MYGLPTDTIRCLRMSCYTTNGRFMYVKTNFLCSWYCSYGWVFVHTYMGMLQLKKITNCIIFGNCPSCNGSRVFGHFFVCVFFSWKILKITIIALQRAVNGLIALIVQCLDPNYVFWDWMRMSQMKHLKISGFVWRRCKTDKFR